MKIRILNNSIRLRLAQEEVASLAAGQAIVCEVPFPDGKFWTYQLANNSQENTFEAVRLDNGIQISISEAAIKELNDSDLVGHDDTITTPNGPLKILVEKDFKCLTPRSEDESGLYENPNDKC